LSKLNLIELREALEASWDATTSYGGASGPGSLLLERVVKYLSLAADAKDGSAEG
jgi:hypothetical protein